MCSIVGVIGNKRFGAYFSTYLAKMLFEGEVRGRQAFGYFACGTPGIHMEKHTGSPSTFFSRPKRIKKFVMRLQNMSTFIGHTRSATSSNVQENKNNHPFATKRFVLSHNGHISNHDSITKTFKIHTKITTDSFVILALIDKFASVPGVGVVEAIERATSVISGSYSCWLYDKTSHVLYLFRHNNPCSYFIENGCLFFASTIDILKKTFAIKNSEFVPRMTKEHEILSFSVGDDDVQKEAEFEPNSEGICNYYHWKANQHRMGAADDFPFAYEDPGRVADPDKEILKLSGVSDDEMEVRKALGRPEIYYHKICERCTAFDEGTPMSPRGLHACQECNVFWEAANRGVSWISLITSNRGFLMDMKWALNLLHITVNYDYHNNLVKFTRPGGKMILVDGLSALIWQIENMYKELMKNGYWPKSALRLIATDIPEGEES